MIVECPKCSTKKIIKITDELRGKKIGFTCKTEGCNEKIRVSIPMNEGESKERKTVILNAQNSASTARLIHIDDNGNELKKYSLSEGTNLIGRKSQSPMANIAIDTADKYMSRTHCTITMAKIDSGSAFLLKDYQSKNDTYVNEHLLGKTEEIYLQNHDVIQMGKTKFKIQIQ